VIQELVEEVEVLFAAYLSYCPCLLCRNRKQ